MFLWEKGGVPIISVKTQNGSGELKGRERSLAQACLCAQVADDYRGQETLVLDLTGVTPIMDYFVVSTATSSRQMRALAEEVDRMMKEHGSRKLGAEGSGGNTWILQDYGDIVLHIFNPESRALYDLEHLWADAPHVDWKAYNTQVHAERLRTSELQSPQT